jgi:hypothetical protein
MAVRSFYVDVANAGPTLTKKSEHLEHGEWKEGNLPPDKILHNHHGHFQNDSAGTGTGAQGNVLYGSDAGDVNIWWKDPFVGSNEFNVEYNPKKLEISWGDISGNNASVKVTITEKLS